MKKIWFTLFTLLVILTGCTSQEGITIKHSSEGYKLFINGKETYIKGVGGTSRLDIARKNGANAFRTWGGSTDEIRQILALAEQNSMYVMQGIDLTKDSLLYFDETYKENKRNEVRMLAETFKDSPHLLAWGVGNEIELGNADIKEAWCFLEELVQIIQSVDKRHLVATVISYNPSALDSIAKYVPSLDYVGINVYGPMDKVADAVNASSYQGPIMITEWGPTGWWETPATEWKAPIEQTSEEKRQVYEERYTQYIQKNPRCLGSFVFLWGQKEERTPTWFSMFVEDKVEGLPLSGEKTPMIEAMQRVWTGKEPEQTAPVIRKSLTINQKQATENVSIKAGSPFTAQVDATDKEEDKLTYVWEILKEATELGFGGSYEPRPERIGKVSVTETNEYESSIETPGQYRLYVYVTDSTGFVSTTNIPFQITE